ncbi:MAG: hypothetical protein OH338_05090 [Candidatus Parvarchaeota archaeon]|nr:hypothetical protein [Candidatus Parvarchaeum tengchongense]
MKSAFLLFHTDYTTELKFANVKDGVARIEDKEIVVDKAKPLILKTRFASVPLYLFKWDSLVPIEPKDLRIYETEITPEMLKRMVEMKLWHFLLKRFRAEIKIASWLQVMGFMILGMIVMFLFIKFRLIPI